MTGHCNRGVVEQRSRVVATENIPGYSTTPLLIYSTFLLSRFLLCQPPRGWLLSAFFCRLLGNFCWFLRRRALFGGGHFLGALLVGRFLGSLLFFFFLI